MPEFIFTFGFGHTDPVTGESRASTFTRIEAEDYEKARDKMNATFGRQWAFEYESEEEAGVQRYGLAEVTESRFPTALEAVLAEIYKPKGIRIWWGARNSLLGGQRAVDVWRTAPDRVLQVAQELADGAYASRAPMRWCSCGHELGRHSERIGSIDTSAGTYFGCDLCACFDFEQATTGDVLVGSRALPAQDATR